jgi:hypothetical protein
MPGDQDHESAGRWAGTSDSAWPSESRRGLARRGGHRPGLAASTLTWVFRVDAAGSPGDRIAANSVTSGFGSWRASVSDPASTAATAATDCEEQNHDGSGDDRDCDPESGNSEDTLHVLLLPLGAFMNRDHNASPGRD